jgi:hypothetical protein
MTTGFWGAGFCGGAGWRGPFGLVDAGGSVGRVGREEGASALRTERMAFPAAGLLGAAAVDWSPCFNRVRIFVASPSLMELLWLLAAMDSFSAASSTSLLSRPRSLDNS